MSDSISREDAIDIVAFECGEWQGLAKEINEQIQRLPSAKPAQKTGKWIKTITSIEKDEKDDDRLSYIGITPYWYCSECGTKYDPALANTIIKYCYKCGAKMVGDVENENKRL